MVQRLTKYPTQLCGPADIEAPVQKNVLRVILGDTRHGVPALKWKKESSFAGKDNIWVEFLATSQNSKRFQKACHPISEKDVVPDMVLHFSIDNLEQIELSFTIFCTSTAEMTSQVLDRAHCSVLGLEMLNCIGVLSRPILGAGGHVSGSLTFEYLIITPFSLPPKSFAERAEFRRRNKQDSLVNLSEFTGHRGMGKTSPARFKENTIFSFIEATRSPHVSQIEFDVQLTKDGFPIVYHDWFFRTHGRDNNSDGSSLPVPIYSLTLAELNHLYTSGIRTEEYITPSMRQLEISLVPISNDSKVQNFLARDKIRTLAEVFMCLPEDIGVMVEVKYPPANVQRDSKIPFPERNVLVDRVLHDVFSVESNSRRSIMFLCFEADICIMLSLKQNAFPVFFSNCDGRDFPCEDLDPRCVSFDQGIDFAASHKFDGILFLEDILKKNPEALEKSKSKGLSILTYGSQNSVPKWAAHQIACGVDSVIADDIHDLVMEAKRCETQTEEKKHREAVKNPKGLLELEANNLRLSNGFSR